MTEISTPGVPPRLVHPGWAREHPWLVQGITTRGDGESAWTLGLFTAAPAGEVHRRWEATLQGVGLPSAVHARQLHSATVRHHRETPPGLLLAEPCDGHVTRAPGVLVTVAVADCVPVTLVDPSTRTVAVLHAGWRGVVGGIAEAGLDALGQRLDVPPGRLEGHLGPAICGSCYEVGPEVHRALGEAVPDAPEPVDLRRVLSERLEAAGVDPARITISTLCTRCGGAPLFSHRGGDDGRQVAFAGVRG